MSAATKNLSVDQGYQDFTLKTGGAAINLTGYVILFKLYTSSTATTPSYALSSLDGTVTVDPLLGKVRILFASVPNNKTYFYKFSWIDSLSIPKPLLRGSVTLNG